MRLDGVNARDCTFVTRILFWFLRLRSGHVPAALRIYAYRPSILLSFLRLAGVVRREGELPQRLKGMAMYWTARTVECSF